MASYRSVSGILEALAEHLGERIPRPMTGVALNPSVKILNSHELKSDPDGNFVGLYLHRISTDPFGRNRNQPPFEAGQPPRPEISINLHILVVGWSTTAAAEGTLLAWAMQELGSGLSLGFAEISTADPEWGQDDFVQVIPEQMSAEDLLRIREGLPCEYRLCAPYLIKTLRLTPA